ncbi:MAG: DUF3592 domain-containing protein [Anaerolineaceae bacterium]|nr:DUF3592 domain-containing protein [Anaerolineaceae bacterium]
MPAEPDLALILIPLLLGGIFGLMGVIFAIVGWRARKKAKISQTWPTTQGTVLSATMVESKSYDHERSIPRTIFKPVVEYSYQVSGVEFNGNRIAFGATSYNYTKAKEILSRYPAGGAVTVHYNPEDASDAALETKSFGGTAFLVVGLVFLAIGVVGCCAALIGLLVSAG